MSLKLEKHVRIEGTLTCLTGLRIGGSKDDVEIGGNDNPIIRHPITRLPYIPGSSIKGKLRSLLEYKHGKITPPNGDPHGCPNLDCLLCRVFGPHRLPNHEHGPTRIIVRDASLTPDSVETLRGMLKDGLLYAEVKSENSINRQTGVAGNPRSQERVPEGTKFDFRISLRIFDDDDEDALIAFVREGLKLLQEDYLGGSGSRGYGQVKVDYEVYR